MVGRLKTSSPPTSTYGIALGLYGVTAVRLTSFTAAGFDGGVELFWQTGSEMENLGFHLFRSMSLSGPYEKISSKLIPGLGSSPVGAKYSYRDRDLENGII